jgi:NAD-dependent SIR2 family protein deacetylase
MPGHVFIVRGDLRKLACDAWLMPCSRSAWPEDYWFLDDHTGPRHGTPFEDGGARVQPFPGWPDQQPQPWLGRVGSRGREIAWYVDGAVEFVHEAAASLKSHKPLFGRHLPLLALPIVGTLRGGAASRCGEVVRGLLRELHRFVSQRDVDVALVCFESSSYAAAQAERFRAESEGGQDWAVPLSPALREDANRLARLAANGELALFLGAGVSQAAGLPDWKGLLQGLAHRAGLSDEECDALAGINTLDQASIVGRRLGHTELASAVKELLGSWKHYSLTHALLAALPVREVVTTNYDQLFEQAWGHPVTDDITILPNRTRAAQTRRWLLKMHGCLSEPRHIVLTRESYTRYDENLPALAGIVQAFLITRHMLFVGFSLADDNFHRIVDAVRRLRENETPAALQRLGTTLTLGKAGLVETLWEDDLYRVAMEPQEEKHGFPYAAAARRLQIFLDYLLSRTRDTSHLLVGERFDPILTPGEQHLRDALTAFLEQVKGEHAAAIRQTVAWPRIQEILRSLGCDLERRFPVAAPAEEA